MARRCAGAGRIRKAIHRVNNLAAVIMTEGELALLLGGEADRTAALRKVVAAVEEMRSHLREAQRALADEATPAAGPRCGGGSGDEAG